MKSFRELIVWQKAIQMTKQVYRISQGMPDSERFGLTSQMRRAATSVPSNITEGYGRGTTRDYVRFLWNANGSVCELETQLLIAKELRLGEEPALSRVLENLAECARVLAGLIRSLENKINQ